MVTIMFENCKVVTVVWSKKIQKLKFEIQIFKIVSR